MRAIVLLSVVALAAGCSSSGSDSNGGDSAVDLDAQDTHVDDTSPPLDATPESTTDAPVADSAGEAIDSGDAFVFDGTLPDGLDATGSCNGLPPAPYALGTQLAELAPTAHGGAITDGIYRMTEVVLYNGPGGKSGESGSDFSWRMRISGTTMQAVFVLKTDVSRGTETMSVGATSIGLTTTCGSFPHFDTYDYDADATHVVLYAHVPGSPDEGFKFVLE